MNKNEKELLIELLLPLFENFKYPGWKSIATELLNQGECIVAGDNCIWIGGVGNFIKLESNTNFIDCNNYVLDYDSFIKSKWVKEYIENKQQLIHEEILTLIQKNIKLSQMYCFCNTIKIL